MEQRERLSYDNPVEVTKAQYNIIVSKFAGMVAHRQDEETGKYYVKVWVPGVSKYIRKIINTVK